MGHRLCDRGWKYLTDHTTQQALISSPDRRQQGRIVSMRHGSWGCLLLTDVEDRDRFAMEGMDSEADVQAGFYFKTKKWMFLSFYCSSLKIVILR